ncbi:24662_t:CDS:1, partial [Gigaspora margarita]
ASSINKLMQPVRSIQVSPELDNGALNHEKPANFEFISINVSISIQGKMMNKVAML